MTEITKHLVEGKMVENNGEVHSLAHLVLLDRKGEYLECSLEDLQEHYSIWFNAEQLEIQRLQAIIENQSKEINKLVLKAKAKPSKFKPLSPAEKREFKQLIFEKLSKGENIIHRDLIAYYGSSNSTTYKLIKEYKDEYELINQSV